MPAGLGAPEPDECRGPGCSWRLRGGSCGINCDMFVHQSLGAGVPRKICISEFV